MLLSSAHGAFLSFYLFFRHVRRLRRILPKLLLLAACTLLVHVAVQVHTRVSAYWLHRLTPVRGGTEEGKLRKREKRPPRRSTLNTTPQLPFLRVHAKWQKPSPSPQAALPSCLRFTYLESASFVPLNLFSQTGLKRAKTAPLFLVLPKTVSSRVFSLFDYTPSVATPASACWTM